MKGTFSQVNHFSQVSLSLRNPTSRGGNVDSPVPGHSAELSIQHCFLYEN